MKKLLAFFNVKRASLCFTLLITYLSSLITIVTAQELRKVSTIDSCIYLRFTQSALVNSYHPATANPTSQELDAIDWTVSGNPTTWRSFLDFNFDTIPAGANITSAVLSLYGDSTTAEPEGDSPLTGSNAWMIERVTSPWNGNSVTWSTMPAYTGIDSVAMPASISQYEDFPNINVTSLVQDIVNNLPTENGLLIKLDTEAIYRSMVFCSNYYPNPAYRPTLNVCYNQCINLRFTQSALVNSYHPATANPTSQELDAIDWTVSGNPTTWRSFLDFNFDTIPTGATIINAYLSLYGDSTTAEPEGDSPLTGSNAWMIERVTSPWNGNTVTWSSMPTYTGIDSVAMPASTSQYENFPNINVTSLVQDIVNNLPTENGLLIKLDTEAIYRSMVFCSNYYPNPAYRPTLTVCYRSVSTGVNNMTTKPALSVYPNPSSTCLTISYNTNNLQSSAISYYEIYNTVGVLVKKDILPANGTCLSTTINTALLASGMYFLRLTSGNQTDKCKFIVTH